MTRMFGLLHTLSEELLNEMDFLASYSLGKPRVRSAGGSHVVACPEAAHRGTAARGKVVIARIIEEANPATAENTQKKCLRRWLGPFQTSNATENDGSVVRTDG